MAAALHGPFGSFLAGLSCPFGKVRQGKGGIALSWCIRRYSASCRQSDRVVCVQPSPFHALSFSELGRNCTAVEVAWSVVIPPSPSLPLLSQQFRMPG